MHTFTYLFLAFLLASTLVQVYLSLRQKQHVSQHRSAVPDPFAGKVTLAEHQKAADYTLAKGSVGRIDLLLGLVILLVWTLGGGLDWLDKLWRSMGWSELYTGTAVIISLMLIGSLLEIPVSLYRTFVLEERFGFNKMTPVMFVTDLLKGTALTLLIGVPLVMLILWLMESAGSGWWLYAWAALTAFSLLMTWAYPKFIAPLFNKFSPLEEGEVAERLNALLTRTGFNSKGVFVMDGSRRSAHGNAYFTGFGKNKRIVFFDTLLKHLTPAQVEAVLAHELGHFKRKHILKGMVLSISMTLAGFALLAWLMQQAWFYTSLGVSQPSTWMALVLFVLVSPIFTFFIGPLMAWWSRKHEFEADAFAAEQSSSAELIAALVGLYRENASTLTPDPLYSAFYDSHPPAAIRIAHLQQRS
ncbi:MAG TPA: M48 family metallopeptidase [Candidatus Thiothrix moscowensis]|uniref:M48 family metallopeptidase n=1 Tax=unclassified Thiothrix TaxID=2636184 RepID=UPI0025CC5CC0|nr:MULTISPECIES: M48 family metallopeptidase [unclassified Thiothrix]HRJ51499.1 M48 family metallopeptidase [Candidatus Thiothrix moscowensis]HRJ91446.1 M48 family metallopeptidase [Candidatus Thiothrix moscowensis]